MFLLNKSQTWPQTFNVITKSNVDLFIGIFASKVTRFGCSGMPLLDKRTHTQAGTNAHNNSLKLYEGIHCLCKTSRTGGRDFWGFPLPLHLSGQSLRHLIPLPLANQTTAQPAPLLHELCAADWASEHAFSNQLRGSRLKGKAEEREKQVVRNLARKRENEKGGGLKAVYQSCFHCVEVIWGGKDVCEMVVGGVRSEKWGGYRVYMHVPKGAWERFCVWVIERERGSSGGWKERFTVGHTRIAVQRAHKQRDVPWTRNLDWT